MNVLICATQVPFVRGGAEVYVDGLREALAARGHRVDVVALPFKWYPKEQLLNTVLAWRLLDLSEANGVPVDLVICTKFPTWAVRHRRKVAWVVHQHRQAYDWFGTPMTDLSGAPEDQALRRRIAEVDRRGLGECVARYAISANVARRLRESVGIDAEPLHIPTSLCGLKPESFDAYVLSVSRLDRAKRVDLLLEALAQVGDDVRAVIVGEGPDKRMLRALATRLGLDGRVEFPGRVPDERVVSLYNRARAVYYGPIDEDYGLVTVEAFTAGKPVVTVADAGGVLELVEDGVSGLVAPQPDAACIAPLLRRVLDDEPLARRLGAAGQRRAAAIGWDRVVARLLGDA